MTENCFSMTTVSGKKRRAATQTGPAAKKAHIEQLAKNKKRPITAPENESDSESAESGSDAEDVEMANVEEVSKGAECSIHYAVSLIQVAAAKESHKVQKALQVQRKAAKPHSSLLADAKRLWSLARQKSIPTKERQKHVRDLMDLIRGKVHDIVFKHDASRIVQTIVKYGGQKERDEVAVELKGKYLELIQSKYSKVKHFPLR